MEYDLKLKNMPTVLRYKGYRFFFVSYDCKEMMHVHVVKERKSCKFWLKSRSNIYLADNNGFPTIKYDTK